MAETEWIEIGRVVGDTGPKGDTGVGDVKMPSEIAKDESPPANICFVGKLLKNSIKTGI